MDEPTTDPLILFFGRAAIEETTKCKKKIDKPSDRKSQPNEFYLGIDSRLSAKDDHEQHNNYATSQLRARIYRRCISLPEQERKFPEFLVASSALQETMNLNKRDGKYLNNFSTDDADDSLKAKQKHQHKDVESRHVSAKKSNRSCSLQEERLPILFESTDLDLIRRQTLPIIESHHLHDLPNNFKCDAKNYMNDKEEQGQDRDANQKPMHTFTGTQSQCSSPSGKKLPVVFESPEQKRYSLPNNLDYGADNHQYGTESRYKDVDSRRSHVDLDCNSHSGRRSQSLLDSAEIEAVRKQQILLFESNRYSQPNNLHCDRVDHLFDKEDGHHKHVKASRCRMFAYLRCKSLSEKDRKRSSLSETPEINDIRKHTRKRLYIYGIDDDLYDEKGGGLKHVKSRHSCPEQNIKLNRWLDEIHNLETTEIKGDRKPASVLIGKGSYNLANNLDHVICDNVFDDEEESKNKHPDTRHSAVDINLHCNKRSERRAYLEFETSEVLSARKQKIYLHGEKRQNNLTETRPSHKGLDNPEEEGSRASLSEEKGMRKQKVLKNMRRPSYMYIEGNHPFYDMEEADSDRTHLCPNSSPKSEEKKRGVRRLLRSVSDHFILPRNANSIETRRTTDASSIFSMLNFPTPSSTRKNTVDCETMDGQCDKITYYSNVSDKSIDEANTISFNLSDTEPPLTAVQSVAHPKGRYWLGCKYRYYIISETLEITFLQTGVFAKSNGTSKTLTLSASLQPGKKQKQQVKLCEVGGSNHCFPSKRIQFKNFTCSQIRRMALRAKLQYSCGILRSPKTLFSWTIPLYDCGILRSKTIWKSVMVSAN